MDSTVARGSKGYTDCNSTKEVRSSCVLVEISLILSFSKVNYRGKVDEQ